VERPSRGPIPNSWTSIFVSTVSHAIDVWTDQFLYSGSCQPFVKNYAPNPAYDYDGRAVSGLDRP
jgi:hypothetical protein